MGRPIDKIKVSEITIIMKYSSLYEHICTIVWVYDG